VFDGPGKVVGVLPVPVDGGCEGAGVLPACEVGGRVEEEVVGRWGVLGAAASVLGGAEEVLGGVMLGVGPGSLPTDAVMIGLEKVVQEAPEAKLKEIASTIANISTHNAYHTGQIIYVRKLQKTWDPNKGVK